MNKQIKMNIKKLITIIIFICIVILSFHYGGLKFILGVMFGTFITAFFMIHYLYKKNETVKAGIDLIGDKLK